MYICVSTMEINMEIIHKNENKAGEIILCLKCSPHKHEGQSSDFRTQRTQVNTM